MTSYTTVISTRMVVVEVDDTTTVTVTEGPATTAAAKVKRGVLAEMLESEESDAATTDVSTTTWTPTPTPSQCDCFETVLTTWVPFQPHQFVFGSPDDDEEDTTTYTKSHHPKTANGTCTTSSTVAPTTSMTISTTAPPAPAPPPATSDEAPVPTTSAAPAPPPAPAPAPAPPPPPAGGLYAMTYTPYDSSGGCKSADVVLSDLQLIKSKGFPRIRMYSTDCNQLSTVADQAISLGLQLTMGIFIDSTGIARGNSELQQLIAWGKWGSVDIINIGISQDIFQLIIGNEAVFGGLMSAGAMVAFIGSCTSALRAAGYGGIISTVETVGTYQANPVLCGTVDSVLHANIHPYFDPGTPSSNAGSFVVSQRNMLAQLCGKQIIVSETGWPHAGGSNGAAIASPADQSTAIASIKGATDSSGITYFSYTDDPWKPAGVEQNFGTSSFFYERS